MLTKRQYLIFSYYVDNRDRYISSVEVADMVSISVRTVKNEMKSIKEFCQPYTSFALETLSGKGTRLSVKKETEFFNDTQAIKKACEKGSENTQSRVHSLLHVLLDASGYLSKYKLMEQFYISESTLYHALHRVKTILKDYDLQLIHKTNLGYRIEGREIDKRMCIAKNEVICDAEDNPFSISEDVSQIYNTVADVFLQYEYQLNEQSIQNITAHIALTIRRVRHGHLITQCMDDHVRQSQEYRISREILERLLAPFRLHEASMENEVLLLTQTILGKLDYSQNEALQNEINEFINDSFTYIRNKFCVNFEPVESLKLFLALHMVPLFYRIRSNTQLDNMMTSQIRQSFPLAYDIALYFCIRIQEQFHLEVSADEISYLSLYFNYGLENIHLGNSAKKLLIITSLRKSETVLLKHKILTWFPNQIAEIRFISPDNEEFNAEDYDAIFSTDVDERFKGGTTLISVFPTEKDYEKIDLALNGYTDEDSILSKFRKECFYYGDIKKKEDVLHRICENARKEYGLSEEFLEVISEREKISSSYFGNGIAIPHPLTPFSEETFVSTAILKEPLSWDRQHSVRVVMLVSIEKNNPRAFQFWYYISNFVRNEELLAKLYEDPSYEHLMEILRLSLEKDFD